MLITHCSMHNNNLYSSVNAIKLYKLTGETCEVKGYINAVPYGPIILKIWNIYIYIYTYIYIYIYTHIYNYIDKIKN